MKKVIEIKNLRVSFKKKKNVINIIRGLDLKLYEGQIVGLVGESGSGKSVTSKTLLNVNEGSLTTIKEMEILDTKYDTYKSIDWKKIRGKQISYIAQNPHTSLNPSRKIYKQILDVMEETKNEFIKGKDKERQRKIKNVQKKLSEETDKQKIKDLKVTLKNLTNDRKFRVASIREVLEIFNINNIDMIMNAYPHELSGGLKQRIIIAMSVLTGAKVIVADEPTTALDATVQSSVLKLLQTVVKKLKISMIFISHNIGVVAKLCDYIYVMYAGRVVERATKVDLFTDPVHPYTWALISSIPEGETKDDTKLYTIPGSPVDMTNLPQGDPFASRNQYAIELDFKKEPPLFEYKKGHWAATWMLHPSYPKFKKPKELVKRITEFKKTLK